MYIKCTYVYLIHTQNFAITTSPDILYGTKDIYSEDGCTPNWEELLKPPPLKEQTIKIDPNTVSLHALVLERVTYTTGQELVRGMNLQAMTFVFEGMFDYLPERYLRKPLLVRYVYVCMHVDFLL